MGRVMRKLLPILATVVVLLPLWATPARADAVVDTFGR